MKTRSTVTLVTLAGAVLFAAACDHHNHFFDSSPPAVHGNGNVVEESRAINGCTRVTLGGVGHLYIEQGAQEGLRIRAEENLLEYLRTDMQGGELRIWKEGVTLRNTFPIEYHLTVVDLEQVALTGAGQIRGSNLATGPLELRAPGVGNVDFFNLNAPQLDVESSGVGDVNVSGSVHEQTIRVRGMGNYSGRDLTSAVADVLIADGGSATVRVEDLLRATIEGSGNVYYIGDPVVESSISGSGDVVKIGG